MLSLTSNPKVSVIMPTYNRARLLPRSINSILSQSFTNFELIVINDGSTDNTEQILSKWKDAPLRLTRFEQNRGIGAARNEGISRATGDLVAFLDSDDLWLPEKLAIDTNIMELYPDIDILFDNYRNINYINGVDQAGFEQTSHAFKRLKTVELEPGVFKIISGFSEAVLVANLIGTPSIVILRRAVFEKIDKFNTSLGGVEDFEFFWRMGLADITIAYHTRILVERHKDSDSVSTHATSFVPNFLTALEMCETTAYQSDREDLIPHLHYARGRAWRNLIHACALEGRRVEAWNAFRNSLRYGFTVDAYIYFMAALAGPNVIQFLKNRKVFNV